MEIHIDYAVQKKCYASTWSYGKICVGCGCCKHRLGRLARDLARLNYWQSELEEQLHFDRWQKGFIRLQRRNRKSSITYIKRRLARYAYLVDKRLAFSELQMSGGM